MFLYTFSTFFTLLYIYRGITIRRIMRYRTTFCPAIKRTCSPLILRYKMGVQNEKTIKIKQNKNTKKKKEKHPKNLLYNLQFSNFEAFSHWLNIISLF